MAALIMSLVALLCAFIVGWRIFSIVIAGVAFIVGVFVLTKVRHAGPSKTMSVSALVFAVIAAAFAGYFISVSRPDDGTQSDIPAELHDSAAAAPAQSTLDRLKNSMDTTQAGE